VLGDELEDAALISIKPESGFQMAVSIVDDLLAISDDPEGFAEA
jgi:hypothetical protein